MQGIAFSHDGTRVLVGSQDGVAKQWPVDHHKMVDYLYGRFYRDLYAEERRQYGIFYERPTCSR